MWTVGNNSGHNVVWTEFVSGFIVRDIFDCSPFLAISFPYLFAV